MVGSTLIAAVIPGAAACAGVPHTTPSNTVPHSAACNDTFRTRMTLSLGGDAQLGVEVDRGLRGGADVDLGHHAAEVLRIVRQVVELRGVEVKLAAGWIEG